jgi:hypothetical protein
VNSIDVYNKCVINLDKYDTPTFSIEDFNTYAEKALYEYINTKYLQFEKTQKRTDDLRQFVKVEFISVSNADRVALPDDYYLLLRLDFRVTEPLLCYDNKWLVGQKTTADKLGYSENNYYWKPSIKRPQFQLIGDEILFRTGDDSPNAINAVRLEYIRVPILYYVNPEDISDFSNPPYTDAVDLQIIDIICRMFQAVTNPQQYQITLNENNLKNN